MFIFKSSLTVLLLIFVLRQARELAVAPAEVRLILRYVSIGLWVVLGLLLVIGVWTS